MHCVFTILLTCIKLNANTYTYVFGKCGRRANEHTTFIVIKMPIFHSARVVHSHAYNSLQLAKYLWQKSKIFMAVKNHFYS